MAAGLLGARGSGQEGDAMKLLSHTALALVALVVFVLGSVTTASADAIDPTSPVLVGTFNFVVEQCDSDIDPFCESLEYFSLTNDIDSSDTLYGGLTFFATVDLGSVPITFLESGVDGFFDGVLGGGESAISPTALVGTYFASAALATLTFTGGNFADYGSLFLSGPLTATDSLATIYLDPKFESVPEPSSIALLASGLIVAALRRRIRSPKSAPQCPGPGPYQSPLR
jgi:hypothetical protein